MTLNSFKRRAYALVEAVSHKDLVSREYDWFDISIIVLIILNTIAVIIGTMEGVSAKYGQALHIFEIFSIAVFSIEYLLRLWTCPLNPKFQRPFWGRLKFMVSPLAIVDLLAVLPFYLPLFIPFDLRFVRAIRLIRILRLLKIGRYSEALKLFKRVIHSRKAELIIAVFTIFILLIISSSLLYYVEHEAQPDKFKNIPEAMWWGVVTLTTVGYGDIYPITAMGKFLAAVISLLGIGLFAMPAGILSAGFIECIQDKKKAPGRCPNCGKELS